MQRLPWLYTQRKSNASAWRRADAQAFSDPNSGLKKVETQGAAENYAFDLTAASLADTLITERRIVEPKESAILGLYPQYR